MKNPRVFKMSVKSAAGLDLTQATITFEQDGKQQRFTVNDLQDEKRMDQIQPGTYRVTVSHPGLESQTREVEVDERGLMAPFFLGKKGQRCFFSGKVRIPVTVAEGEIGYRFRNQADSAEMTAIEEAGLRQFGGKIRRVGKEGLRKWSLPKTATAATRKALMAYLRAQAMVEQSGAVMVESADRLAFITSRMVVQFKEDKDEKEIQVFISSNGLELVSKLPGSNSYLVAAGEAGPDGLLEFGRRLHDEDWVVSTLHEWNASATVTALPPTDQMMPEQWHLDIVDVPEAWAALRAANPIGVLPDTPGDLTFGHEDLVIGVVDYGIHTYTPPGALVAVSTHPEFSGNVTSGNAKLYQNVDFTVSPPVVGVVSPTGAHGMNCAGTILASQSNGPLVLGVPEGVVGIAPNTRLLGSNFATATTDYIFLYNWAAGLPENNYPGALTKLEKGMDIVNNSWRNTRDHTAVSDAAADALDAIIMPAFETLTIFGRKGRGVVVLFSSSNAYGDANYWNPMSTHPRTIGVGASTLDPFGNEMAAPYSNYGGNYLSGAEIDVIAPSHSDYLVPPFTAIEHDPPVNLGAITTSMHADGRLPSGANRANTFLSLATTVASNVISVPSVTRFSSGMPILIGTPGTVNFRAHVIISTDDTVAPQTMTLDRAVGAVFAALTPVVGLMGNMPGGVANVETELVDATAAASVVIRVRSTAAFVVGQTIYFDQPGGGSYRAGVIAQINTFEYLSLSAPLGMVIPVGTPVTGIASTFTTVAVIPVLAAGVPTVLRVAATAGLLVGQKVLIHTAGAVTSELRTITGVTPAGDPSPAITLELPALANAHAVGTQVRVVGGLVRSTHAGAPVGGGGATLTLESSAGFQVGQAIVIGVMGAVPRRLEYNIVSTVPSMNTITVARPLRIGFRPGDVVFGGAASYSNDFGGTSFATPVVSGIAALILTAKPSLTWIEVRDILRSTAIKIQPGDVSANGIWVDVNNVRSTAAGYVGPHYSAQYGYGRVDANVAVRTALAYDHNDLDLYIRNQLSDDGVTEQTKGLDKIDSPDLWIRNAAPAVEGAAALPASNNVAGPHEKPLRNRDRWIYMRVHNRGNVRASSDAWARIYVAIVPDEPEFSFPDAWIYHGGVGALSSGVSNLYLLNPVAGGSPLWSVAPVLGVSPGVGIPPLDSVTTSQRWNAGFIPGLPFTHLRMRSTRATVIGENFILVSSSFKVQVGQKILFGVPGDANHTMLVVDAGTEENRINFTGPIGAVFPDGTSLIPLSLTVQTNLGPVGYGIGVSTIIVLDASAFKIGQYVHVGTAGTSASSEIFAISHITLGAVGTHTLTFISPTTKAIAAGAPVTLISNPVKTFIVGEVSPHDGTLAGSNFYNNSNITYKEVNLLIDITFRDAADAADLTASVSLDTAGTPVTTDFRIHLSDAEQFGTERTRIIATRHHLDSANDETVSFSHTGAAWAFDTAPAAAWLVINSPVDAAGAAAAGLQADVHFTGSFTVDGGHNKVSFKVVAGGNAGVGGAGNPFICVKDYDVAVFTLPGSAAGLGASQSSKPTLHAWADMGLFQQQLADETFGPDPSDPTTKFRLTSFFRIDLDDAPIYAAFTGTIFLQRSSTDPAKVNLILKPLRQSRIGYTAVKYFVYRGLLLSDFLKGESAADELLVRANDVFASPFIQYIQGIYAQLQSDTGAPVAPLSSRALGWDPASQLETDLVDQYFYGTNPDFQLPVVPMGMQLGTFTGFFERVGVEIVLEEGIYQPTLAWARSSENLIDLSVGGPYDDGQLAEKREEILHYIDPAAYYGMHYSMGVYTADSAKPVMTKDDLFTYTLSKYVTRHNVYIDVRNESGYSLNYYRNYNDASGITIRIGNSTASMVDSSYGTSGWPLIIRSAPSGLTSDKTTQVIQLPVGDNVKPLLFVEWSELVSESAADKFVGGEDLLPPGLIDWTKHIEFATPNIVNPAVPTEKVPVAEVIKLHYFRHIVAVGLLSAGVVQANAYHQNVFGPIDAPELFEAGGSDIEWVSAQDKRFIDNSAGDLPFAYVAERGVAHENERVIYWASASDRYAVATEDYADLKGITAGVSTKGNFFDVAYLFRGLSLEIVTVKEETAPGVWTGRKLIKFTRVAATGMAPENILLLGLMETEAAVLAGLAGFSPHHERSILLEAVAGSPFTDPGGKKFQKYKLKVQGWDSVNRNYFVAQPADAGQPDIHVYSADGYVFCAAAFGAAQPIPAVYTPTAEEQQYLNHIAERNTQIAAAPSIESLVNDFEAEVATVTNDALAIASLNNLVQIHGANLFDLAVAHAKANKDDLVLYHARTALRYFLRHHPYFLGKDDERKASTLLLENLSRNLHDITFPGAGVDDKKVLLLGIDPDMTLPTTQHVGSIVALALHDETLFDGLVAGKVHTLILPRRYADLRDGMLDAALETLLREDTFHMAVVIGHDIVQGHLDLERFASRHQGRYFDNEATLPPGEIGTKSVFDRFYQTDVPVEAMVPGPFGAGQDLYYDESVSSTSESHPHPRDGGPNGNVNSFTLTSVHGKPRVGSGGDGFANELYYRLCHLRKTVPGTHVKVGMLTVPTPANLTGGAITIDDLIDRVKTILTNALSSL